MQFKNKFIALILFLLIFTAKFTFSQNEGAANTGLAFLKLGVSSRSIALGEAVVSNSFDASATHYNPALLFNGSNLNILFMHNQQVLGLRTEFLAAKIKFSKFAFGLSINNTAVDNIQIREIPGEPVAEFNAQNFALGISAAYKINSNLSFGLTSKFLYEKIYIDNASGIAFDFAAAYQKNNFSIGASFSNFGSMSNLRNQPTKLPSSFRLGASYFIPINSLSSQLLVSADAFKVLDGGKFHAHSGAELIYKNFLAIRAGFQSGYENKFITAGIGLKYKAFSLDYAFVPYKFSLGSSHTITLCADF
jgi:long-subunit fatty acid transport protein